MSLSKCAKEKEDNNEQIPGTCAARDSDDDAVIKTGD
jgi:hypothetical protein